MDDYGTSIQLAIVEYCRDPSNGPYHGRLLRSINQRQVRFLLSDIDIHNRITSDDLEYYGLI